jgi:hypothetical protein
MWFFTDVKSWNLIFAYLYNEQAFCLFSIVLLEWYRKSIVRPLATAKTFESMKVWNSEN